MLTKKINHRIGTLIGPNQLDMAVDRAINWLSNSGIQNTSLDPEVHGSFSSWYEQDTRTYPFGYSEITGYLVTFMCYLWDRTQNRQYLQRAIMAGDWLLRTTHEPKGGFRCLIPLHPSQFDFKRNQVYAFDNGIIVNGLTHLYRATKQEKYLASAVTAADWLVYSAQKTSGAFHPIYQLDEERFFESDKEWSMCSGSYHAKIAIGLLNLYDLTGKEKYLNGATGVCDFALQTQEKTGRFITFPWRGGTNAHPHCYTAEALWSAGSYLQRADYLKASAHGVKWLLDMQSMGGYIPRLYKDGVPVYSERVDAICQTLRLGILHLAGRDIPKKYRRGIEKLLALILKYQVDDEDPSVEGGFYFGRSSSGRKIPHVNSWVTAFAIQALQVRGDYYSGKMKLPPFFLV